jgi:O-antigen/teichoic acid export membrane protein
MTAAFVESNVKLVDNLYKSMVLKTLSYTIPVILIICLFAPVIVPFLFSEKYAESVPYFQLYLFTFIFSAMGNGLALRATGQTKHSFYAYLYSLILIIPVTFFGIKYFALNGAIVSAVFSSVLPRILLTKYDISVLKCKVTDLLPLKEIGQIILISLLLIIPFGIMQYSLPLNIWIVAFCICVYIACVFAVETYFNLFVFTKTEINNYLGWALTTLRIRQSPFK